MARRAAKSSVSPLRVTEVTTKLKQFLKKNILFENGFKSVSKQFTTDKQYIQNTWKTVIVINEFSYLYFQVKQFLKIPAEKLYGMISFDSYAIVYMQKREKVSTLRGFVASKNMWHRYDKNEKQNNPLIEQFG